MAIEAVSNYYVSRLSGLLGTFSQSQTEEVHDDPCYEAIKNPIQVERANPAWGQIRYEIENTLAYVADGTGGRDLKDPNNWKILPWTGEELDPLKLLEAGMSFNAGPFGQCREFFPRDDTSSLKERIINLTEKTGIPLTFSEVYALSLKESLERYHEVYPLASAIIAHSTTRWMARNSIPQMSLTHEEMRDWQKRIARFEVPGKCNNVGGLYHGMCSLALGMAGSIKWDSDEIGMKRIASPILNAIAPQVEEPIARITSKITGKPRDYVHHPININAVQLGGFLVNTFYG